MWISLLLAAAAASPDLSTVAERSGDLRTGRYDEVVALCTDFERAFPGKAKCARFGTTPEGRPMLAVVASHDGTLDPDAARRKKRPVLLFQGGIHAGEIDGKDAGFRVLRDALRGKVAPGALRAVTLVFVPVFNVDGHERVSRFNRPNQRGPEEMGWRATAQNLNLNRDYAKADAPEMRAMLALLRAWDPVLYVDLHVTDGAKFRHDVSITVEPSETPGEPLR
ncbi:MAG TPA: M14 family zinc carboxypeptidase, partial [Candidatus Polarisedimenticolaceae bacterium]|nr:M14 family zinc carboxypeptidase [Candidatus Polarisedimenticolaceae bacterium]